MLYVSQLREAVQDRPVVRFYSSDATPVLMTKQWAALIGALGIVRRGRKCFDLLCERTYLSSWNHEGTKDKCVHFRDPTPLTRGKTGWPLMACELNAAPSIRSCGFYGPVVSAYVFGRGCFSILSRLIGQKGRLQKENIL